MDKEPKIREFIEDIEAITESTVIGLDFIAIGNGDNYFQDYLIHSKSVDDYLKALTEFFKENPSLLVTDLECEIAKISNNDGKTDSSNVTLTFQEKKVPKDEFILNYTCGREMEYWNNWCNIISKFYLNCSGLLFIKLNFGSLDQTTALFIYFNTDISTLDDRRKGWLSKASKAFLYEEAVSVFMPKHIEKIEELERLKTRTMFSLTTHSLKTHLDTGVIKLKNSFKEKLNSYPTLLNDFGELDEETEELRKLTSLLSLIDKIDDANEFKKEAVKSNLLTESNSVYNLSEHLIKFNARHAAMPDVKVKSNVSIEKLILSIPVFGMYFSDSLLNLFFNTLFENVIAYGKCDKNIVELTIEVQSGDCIFSNETEDAIIPLDPTKLRGNLRLFQLLIQETKSGSFLIDNSASYKFKIEIKSK